MNTMTLPVPVCALLFASMGATATALGLRLWQAAATAEEPVLWWASRATGFVAYGALALSVLFGVMVSSKGSGGLVSRKAAMDLHQQWTLSAVVATVLHIITTVFHVEAGVTPWATVIPFASRTLTGPVAIGTVAFLGLAVIAATSWWRKRVPYAAWRAIHALAFGVMVLALAHSVTAGTDTPLPAVRWMYIATAAVLLGVTVTRVLVALGDRHARA